ncbi:MAG TPA: prepilin-type N-terminal cleavage/methylation domain-containing protein [Nitrospiria bacterium]|nr:prepilin-type N-terminal cleavage/methylation domain-containing protein [Nitrospiria bacterium]
MRNERGVTLIELIFSVILIGIIGIVAARAFLYSSESVLTGTNVREGTQVNRIAMDRMIREIRNVANNTSVNTAGATTFTFVDTSNNTISYTLSGTNLNRVTATTDTLAANVSSLTFTYLDNTGATIATPAVSPAATDIWWVQIALTVGTGSGAVQFRSRVHPRSF